MFNMGAFKVKDLERFVIGICRWGSKGREMPENKKTAAIGVTARVAVLYLP